MRAQLLCAIGLVVSGAISAEGLPVFRFSETPGPYPVGLKIVEQYDHSRVYRHLTDDLGNAYHGERARPLQTLVWYPAQPGNAPPLNVRDYMSLWATETSFEHAKMPARAQEWLNAMAPTLGMSLRAKRDAPVAPGRYPVVIYAPGLLNMSWNNADLCEYLASFGYIVLGTSSLGIATREITVDVADLNTQAQDISFLIGYAQALADADTSEVAVAGQSWGGPRGE